MAKYLVTLNLYGNINRCTTGVIETDKNTWAVETNADVQEILASRSYFMDNISPAIFTQLKKQARKDYDEKIKNHSNRVTIHQVVMLSSDDDNPSFKL